MSDKKPDIHEVNRLNEYEERDAWDMFIDIWTSKLGILAGSIIILGLAVVAILLILGYFSISIVWGETEVIAILSVVASLALGGWFIVLPMLHLSSSPFELLFKVNSTHDTILDAWIMHPIRMAKVSVTEGSAHSMTVRGISVYIVREYDPKTREAKGTWRGEMNDLDLETHVEAMKQNRGKLRNWAQIGQQLYSKLPGIAQAVESAYWRAMSDQTLDKTTVHPDVVKSETVESVDKLVDSIETPEEPNVEKMMEEQADAATDGKLGEETNSSGGDSE